MTIAVTGATGYLGTHMLLCLEDRGDVVVGIAEEEGLPAPLDGKIPYTQVPMESPKALSEAFAKHKVTSIIHFAGDGTIPASFIDPLHQYTHTLLSTLTMLNAAKETGVEQIVFSSTASVYGVPERMPIHEETPLKPISPYGAAMAMAERIVQDVCKPACITTAVLRYFNVAGADPLGRAGEGGGPRHLIKAAAQIATGVLDEPLKIYGDDYDTPDGTPIRDYIHVSDMASAHGTALDHLKSSGQSVVLNCGYGEGISVHDVIASVQRVTGTSLDTKRAPRRPGDPPQLIADNAAIRTTLGWTPRYDDIDLIVKTAVAWEDQCKNNR
ncbi:MAG: UDP-glucose 4-epimerase GalE [Pseudomonadota bacterium]